MFALLDMNSFYASCEQVFRPDLVGRPVVVLSNGDACVVARSAEAKELGIKMGQPWFQIRHLAPEKSLVAFSSNYALYADLSARIMQIIRDSAPRLEVYSIDEAFMDLAGVADPAGLSQEIRQRVREWVGVPACVGLGLTKTRAKISNFIAKKNPQHGGVFNLEALSPEAQRAWLSRVGVGEVWGVGPRLTQQLESMGVRTAADLQASDPESIRKYFSITLARTVEELQGISRLELEEVAPAKQQIMVSRSFGPLLRLEDLQSAIASFTVAGAERLRAQNSVAHALLVFARTSFFREDVPQYSGSKMIPLVTPTQDTRQLIAAAYQGLDALYRPGFRYQKAGVLLTDLSAAGIEQTDLFSRGDTEQARRLMAAVDGMNRKMGRGTVFIGAQRLGEPRRWKMRAERKSKAYTTNWKELAITT